MDLDGRPSPGFQIAKSKTYSAMTFFGLDLETRLGSNATALFATDHVGLMLPNSGGPVLADQAVGLIKDDKSFFLGLLGLSPQATNFTNYDHPVPSYLSALKAEGYIPSRSFAYTAGAYYSESPTLTADMTSNIMIQNLHKLTAV
jgi:hypothetical protein